MIEQLDGLVLLLSSGINYSVHLGGRNHRMEDVCEADTETYRTGGDLGKMKIQEVKLCLCKLFDRSYGELWAVY